MFLLTGHLFNEGSPDHCSDHPFQPANAGRCKRCWIDPRVGKIPWKRAWQPTPVVLPGEFHGQRSLEGYSLWGRKESDTTKQLNNNNIYLSYVLPVSPIRIWGFPDSSIGKESACNAGDPGSITGSGRCPGEGIGYPFQYSWASLWPSIIHPTFLPFYYKIHRRPKKHL